MFLFERSEHDLLTLIDQYFQQLSERKKIDCIRCNSRFDDTKKDFCLICGWDYQLFEMLDKINSQNLFAVIQKNNTEKLWLAIETNILRYKCNYAKKELTDKKQDCETKQAEINKAKSIIEELKASLNKKQILLQNLMEKEAELEDCIREIKKTLRNTDSLYKLFKPLQAAFILTLRVDGHQLIAHSKDPVNFPVDMIMALAPLQTRGNEIVKNAYCFMVLKAGNWTQNEPNKWCFELGNITPKHLETGRYYAQFSLFEQSSYGCKIEFISKMINVN